MAKDRDSERLQPPQKQDRQPGLESEMTPRPRAERTEHRGSGKLRDKVAIITGGDSGIGRAVAIAFAREGSDVVVAYLDEHDDARETKHQVEQEGRKCVLVDGDVGDPGVCHEIARAAIDSFGRVDVLVNNAAEQHPRDSIKEITPEQLERTFRTNIFSYFFMTQAILDHLEPGSSIINTTSVTAYKGNPQLIDYTATKGAIVAFTRALSHSLVDRGIRVNAVAPGPIWTPLIPATFPPDKVASFGAQVPMKRAGQPAEVASCFVFLAAEDASYITGQVLHPNGGEVVNG
jgi:NAD(P)-dependent dehydrogenase (short-subunit alcohol dehydrogenase family)